MSNNTGGTARTPEQISEALYPGYNPGGGIREAATAGAREALTEHLSVSHEKAQELQNILRLALDTAPITEGTREDLERALEIATTFARGALPPADFKPAGQGDEYRDAYEQIEEDTVFRVKVEGHYRDGMTVSPYMVTRDQARRILIMLSQEGTL